MPGAERARDVLIPRLRQEWIEFPLFKPSLILGLEQRHPNPPHFRMTRCLRHALRYIRGKRIEPDEDAGDAIRVFLGALERVRVVIPRQPRGYLNDFGRAARRRLRDDLFGRIWVADVR